jgi:hypothetical protein
MLIFAVKSSIQGDKPGLKFAAKNGVNAEKAQVFFIGGSVQSVTAEMSGGI